MQKSGDWSGVQEGTSNYGTLISKDDFCKRPDGLWWCTLCKTAFENGSASAAEECNGPPIDRWGDLLSYCIIHLT